MVSTRKKKRQRRRLRNQLDEFVRDASIGNSTCEVGQNTEFWNCQVDIWFTSTNQDGVQSIHEYTLSTHTSERSLLVKCRTKVDSAADTVKIKIWNNVFSLMDIIIVPRTERVVRPTNDPSGLDVGSVLTKSECQNE